MEEAIDLTHSQQASRSTISGSANVEIRNTIVSENQGQEKNLRTEVENVVEQVSELKEHDGKHLGVHRQQFFKPFDSFSPNQTYQEIERSLGSGSGTNTMHPPSESNNSSGNLDKMHYYLSDTLQNIDPVPVVGVSGGMGALYLLLKLEPSLVEEDLDNESVLDSINNTQISFQVIKDMEMEILDMIKLI
ncbi:hypothetical protein PCYB_003310 [Plasmodium cynomolgi strain B]|uniref:CYIR protein n=1 Tax=Plasmodium cynomolgi (strain B) TaxID=1120755 RepID=K6VJK0_PLACD|nr:hypothetical protein PCYB_003310 [Plasmodium cynomolgi strain B]GAB69582.1 hypothetical protein PCYB_003310 [Plasmodium cynomolgi strain B]